MLLWYIKRYILSTRALNLVQIKQINLKGSQMKEFIYGLITIAMVIFFAYCFTLTL